MAETTTLLEQCRDEWRKLNPTHRRAYKGIAVLVIGVMAFVSISQAADSGPTSARDYCEQLWNENQATAHQGAMTKDLYVANCTKTQHQIESGEFPGQ